MIGCVVPISEYIGSRASEQHNTFLLVAHAVIEATLFAMQFSISSDIMAMSEPAYTTEFRENCLRNEPGPSRGCNEYLESDRYAGMHLVWAYNFDIAMDDSDYYVKLTNLQNSGDCCGFGQVLGCSVDNRPIPSDRISEGVSKAFSKQRQTCGEEEGWFPTCGTTSNLCSQAIDPTASRIEIGGCKFEMPLGACKDSDPEAGTKGCAAQIEDTMNAELNGRGAIILLFTFFQVQPFRARCCVRSKGRGFRSSFSAPMLCLPCARLSCRSPHALDRAPGTGVLDHHSVLPVLEAQGYGCDAGAPRGAPIRPIQAEAEAEGEARGALAQGGRPTRQQRARVSGVSSAHR